MTVRLKAVGGTQVIAVTFVVEVVTIPPPQFWGSNDLRLRLVSVAYY